MGTLITYPNSIEFYHFAVSKLIRCRGIASSINKHNPLLVEGANLHKKWVPLHLFGLYNTFFQSHRLKAQKWLYTIACFLAFFTFSTDEFIDCCKHTKGYCTSYAPYIDSITNG